MSGMAKDVQAKAIGDVDMLRAIDALAHSKYPDVPDGGWVFTWDLERAFPALPEKVVLAKARALLRKGLIDGCGCGCRGDFELTAKGAEALRREGQA